MILSPTLTLSAGSGAAIVRPTFSRDFAGEKTLNNGTGPAITFTRASDATFFDANGTLQTASNDAPRFDHSGGSSLGLLIEEARTNLLLNSATLATQTITVTAVAHTLSFYGTGQVVLSGAHSATVTGTGAFPTRTSLTFTPSAGSLTATVSGTVEYAQLEVGAFATSYITTTGATATRAADSAVVTPISSFYNASEGTLFAETFVAALGQSFPTILDLNNGTDDTNAVTGFFNKSSGNIEYGTTGFSYAVAAAAGTNKSAAALSAASARMAVNGTLSSADDTSVTMATDKAALRLGARRNGSEAINGHIRKVAYWPRRLSNALLQTLTT